MDNDKIVKNKILIKNNLDLTKSKSNNCLNYINFNSSLKNRKLIKFITKKSIKVNKPKRLHTSVLGLKEISKKVFNIINDKNIFSYKQIVEEFFNRFLLEEKEAKNIKRRIYDSLNVINATNNFIKKEKELSKKLTITTQKQIVSYILLINSNICIKLLFK